MSTVFRSPLARCICDLLCDLRSTHRHEPDKGISAHMADCQAPYLSSKAFLYDSEFAHQPLCADCRWLYMHGCVTCCAHSNTNWTRGHQHTWQTPRHRTSSAHGCSRLPLLWVGWQLCTCGQLCLLKGPHASAGPAPKHVSSCGHAWCMRRPAHSNSAY